MTSVKRLIVRSRNLYASDTRAGYDRFMTMVGIIVAQVVPATLVIAITAACYDSDNVAITTADGAPQTMQVSPEPL
ncbi:unnamed protein product [Arctogadus glacialis]